MGLAVLGGPGGVVGGVMNESFGCVKRRPRWRKTALRVQAPVHRGRIVTFRERRARLSTDCPSEPVTLAGPVALLIRSAIGADRHGQLISARCGLANLALQLRVLLPGFAAPPWFGSSRPMLSAVVCSGAGRGQGTALEDFGEKLGGGGEMFLVPGPYAPPQVGKADLQLVAVVAYGGVDEGALVGS